MSLAQAVHHPHVIWYAYGDIHLKQRLPSLPKQCNGWYTGSPIPMDFGETPDRGGLVVAFDDSPGGWVYAGRRYVRLDADFDPLVTVKSEADLLNLPKNAWIRLDPEVQLPRERHERVLAQYRVVDDRSTPEAAALVVRDATNPNQQSTITGFDPLLSDLSVVEDDVLRDLTALDKDQAKPLVGAAIERYRNRIYLT